jgi:hypothetical protein
VENYHQLAVAQKFVDQYAWYIPLISVAAGVLFTALSVLSAMPASLTLFTTPSERAIDASGGAGTAADCAVVSSDIVASVTLTVGRSMQQMLYFEETRKLEA